MTQAWPLHWPDDRPRTAPSQRRNAAFKRREHNGRHVETKFLTIATARERLQFEIEQLDARNVILSTNVELRLDGKPRSSASDPVDPGVALWFTLRGRDMVLACDRWNTVADNIAAIAKHIEAIRGIERWGVGSIEQAFAGYQALPATRTAAPATHPWHDVLGLRPTATRSEIMIAWRTLMRGAHPDHGGSHAAAAELNHARDEALRGIF